jgi:hypothetical protein
MIPINIKCFECKNGGNLWGITPKCKAFQNGIPREIIYEGQPHTKPLPDQNNDIVFEPIKK